MRTRLVLVLWCAVAVLGLMAGPAFAAGSPAQSPVKSGALTWRAAQHTDPARGLTSVSCVSKTSCRAGDATDLVLRWNGHQWQKGYRFPADAAGIDAMSCTSKEFCAAAEVVDTAGGIAYRPVTRNANGTWDTSAATTALPRRSLGLDPGTVSCTSASFCMLVNAERGFQRWNGKSWTAPVTFQKESRTTLVSCASPTMCKAVGDVNRGEKTVYTWNGSSWSAPQHVPVLQHIDGLSCPTTSFCMLILGPDYVTLSGSHVSAAKLLPRGIAFGGLSCTSASFCIGTNGGKQGSIRWNGSSWSGPHKIKGQSFLIVSCSSPSFCAAVSYQGDAVNRVDGTWQKPRTVERGTVQYGYYLPDDVSCSGARQCVLVNGSSAAFAFDGTSWSGPHRILPHSARDVLSCPTTAFCAAGTANGMVQFRREGHWTKPQRAVSAHGVSVDAISCTSSKFCAILTDSGALRVYRGSGWSTVGRPTFQSLETALSCVAGGCVFLADSTSNVDNAQTWIYRTGAKKLQKAGSTVPDSPALSCVSLKFCLSSGIVTGPTTTRTAVQQFDGTSWHKAPTAGGVVAGTDVSCTSTTFCVVVGGLSESTWNGTRLSADHQIVDPPIGPLDYLNSVSCRPGVCAATTTDGWTVVAR